MLTIGLIEPWVAEKHGFTNESQKNNLQSHYYCIYHSDTNKCTSDDIDEMNDVYECMEPHFHNPILSYEHSSPQIIKLEEIDDVTVAIPKTYFLKLLQRKWRGIYKEKQRILELRKNPKAIMYRRSTGKWPDYCSKY